MTINTGMIPVFEEKLQKLLKSIEKEYEKPKSERNKNFIKNCASDAKKLRKLLKKCKEEMGGACCPHCGEEI